MFWSGWLTRYRENWALLRKATAHIGVEIESWPYEALDKAAEEQPPLKATVAGYPVHFQIDCITTLPNGDLHICMDAHGGPPTLFGVKPSYVFYKRRDGTVHYG